MTDLTLDEMRAVLAAELPKHAAFDGWKPEAVAMAAEATGIDADVATLAFLGGAVDMIDAWFAHVDRAMLQACPPERLAVLKIREKIAALVEARLDVMIPDIEALRRALAVLAMPQNVPRALKLGWRAADAMWRAAGDKAVDLNHYSKRALLAGVYGTTLMALLADDSEGHADTRAFLARRIEGVMQFEKVKARFAAKDTPRFNPASFLGRFRYPAE